MDKRITTCQELVRVCNFNFRRYENSGNRFVATHSI